MLMSQRKDAHAYLELPASVTEYPRFPFDMCLCSLRPLAL